MSTSAPVSGLSTPDQLLTASQAARLLDVHISTIRRWIGKGKLPAYRVGDKGVRIRYDDVLSLLSPLNLEKGGPMAQPERIRERLLTKEEQQRGLKALRELEELDKQQGDELLPDSTDLIYQMRDERTSELMRKLEE